MGATTLSFEIFFSPSNCLESDQATKLEPTLGPTETAKPGYNSRDGASNQPRTPTEINDNCALLTLSRRTHHALLTQMHSRTEPNKLTAIRGRERNPSGSPTVPNLSRPGNELKTRPLLARPAPAREQFCPCCAAVARARGARGVTGHGGVCGDVVFCSHPERPAFAAGARGRRLLGALWPVSGSSRRPRGAARCLRSGGEDGAGQPGTRRAPPRVTGARPRASAEPPLCGAVSEGHGRGRRSGRGGRNPGRAGRGGARRGAGSFASLSSARLPGPLHPPEA